MRIPEQPVTLPTVEQLLDTNNVSMKLAIGGLATAALVASGFMTEAVHADSTNLVEIVAHRGSVYGLNKHYTENSLEGVKQVGRLAAQARVYARHQRGSTEVGAVTVEGDLYPSKTKHANGTHTWWVMHDPRLNRTTNGKGTVSSHPDSYLHKQRLNDGEHIPTFTQEVAAAARTQAHVELEIKPANVSVTDLTYLDNIIKQQGLHDHFTFTSVHRDDLKRLEQIDPSVRKGYIVSHPVSPQGIKGFADAVLYKNNATTPHTVAAMHGAGLQVETWTIDSPKQWRKAFRAHVDGIITDSSKLLYGWLKKHHRKA